ncbi:MAG: hypothetical protein H6870_13380 [Methylobacteriaceae bacterium]|nr:hypothetical protein [Methylobacteriaceae bacterium]
MTAGAQLGGAFDRIAQTGERRRDPRQEARWSAAAYKFASAIAGNLP